MDGEFLYRKTIDKSILYNGITIPIKYHQKLYDKFGYIEKGTSIRLPVWVNGEPFEILLTHVSFTNEI